MSDEARFDRIDKDIAAIHTQLGKVDGRLDAIEERVTGIEGRLTGIEDRVTGIEGHVSDLDHRLTKVEVTQDAMRDDIKMLAEGFAATNAAIDRSADRIIAYIDERISPIEQDVRHLSR